MKSLFHLAQSAWRKLPEGVRDTPPLSAVKSVIRRLIVSHDDIYDRDYFTRRQKRARRSAEVIAETIYQDLKPTEVLDVGCGTGDLLDELRKRGVPGRGLEYATAAIEICQELNLSVDKFDLENHQLDVPPAVDVVISLEVAEHLPEPLADRYLDIVCVAQRAIVFSAAVPGVQGGTDHVNEQPREYWIERMAQRGFVLDQSLTQRWQTQWRERPVEFYYRDNLMIYRASQ